MEVFLQEHTCVRNLLGCEVWKEQKGDPLEVGLVTSVLSLSGDTEGNVCCVLSRSCCPFAFGAESRVLLVFSQF